MSWLKTVVSRAVEVSGERGLGRTVRLYADTVVQHAGQAVAGGVRILQNRIGNNNHKSFKHAVKRLEEAAVSCRGKDRLELLKRWLISLKEIEKICGASQENRSDDSPQSVELPKFSPTVRKSYSLVLFFDSDQEGGPLNFCEVFLQSQALEGMTMSMILEEPNDEEVSLLMEIFGFCLTGGTEVHNAIIRNIQDLAAAFSNYEDEILVKREELLQFAQCAISGLKFNPYLARIDSEALTLWHKIYNMEGLQISADKVFQKTSLKRAATTIEDELGVSVNLIKALVDNLKNFNEREDGASTYCSKVLLQSNSREILEQEYLQVEKKIITALTVVDHMKELFYAEQDGVSRIHDPQIEDLFNSIEKVRKEFGTIERPKVNIENSKEGGTSLENTLQNAEEEEELAKLESEYGSTTDGYSSEYISGWEL